VNDWQSPDERGAVSDFGKWHGDRAGIVRFEPLRLEVFACKIAGWAPSFEDFSGYSTVVKAQALFVLNRYLCNRPPQHIYSVAPH
jgi:hypothetical protein